MKSVFENSPELLKKISVAVQSFNCEQLRLYPDPGDVELCELAAQKYGVNPGQVLFTNGAENLIQILLRSFVDPGACVLEVNSPIQFLLRQCQIHKANFISLCRDSVDQVEFDMVNMLKNASLVFLVNPDFYRDFDCDKTFIRDLCRKVQCPVVIDESYVALTDDSCIDLLDECPNVIILKTLPFLKNIPVALILASDELIIGMNKVRDSYPLSSLSQMIVSVALTS